MSIKDWKVRIEDILEAIDRIESYTDDMSRDAFIANPMAVDAVVRNLEIVGEASHRVPSWVRDRWRDIPWNRMSEVRNVLVHEYHAVDAGLIYDTARNDLPPLVRPLKALLFETAESEAG